MKARSGILLIAAAGVAALLLSVDVSAARKDKWEMTLQARYTDGTTFGFDGGATAELDDAFGWGFGIGYNFTDQLALSMDFSWSSMNYTATAESADTPGTTRQITGRADTSSTQLNLTYYFSPERLTPFVAGGLGWTWVDSNIASAPPATGCWWDPWWGYVCYPYQPTYSATEFSYNAALGVRWDIRESFFLRASIGKQWIDLDKASGTPDITLGRFDIGFAF
jgi:opacity protein-like surface antigen